MQRRARESKPRRSEPPLSPSAQARLFIGQAAGESKHYLDMRSARIRFPQTAMENAVVSEANSSRPLDANKIDKSQITVWLQPQEILLDVEVSSRFHALEVMASAIGRRHGLESAPIARAL